MDNQEAKSVLAEQLELFRKKSYTELGKLIGKPTRFEITSPTGNWYQIQIQVEWDSIPEGNLRVLGSIDDGGLRAFLPVCNDFIMDPNGNFVGE